MVVEATEGTEEKTSSLSHREDETNKNKSNEMMLIGNVDKNASTGLKVTGVLGWFKIS